MGLTALEAEVYTYLSRSQASTGYRVAQALGKPTANVYKAIRTLQLKGALVVEDGDSRRCRAVPATELLDRLEREFRNDRTRAEEALSRLPQPSPDARIYHLRSREQVLDSCRRILREATTVVVVDAFPGPLQELADDLDRAAGRGASVIVKSYAPLQLKRARVVLEPHAERVLQRWHADWCNLVVDGSRLVIALVDADGPGVVQAVWSESPYLAWIFHNYVARELTFTIVEAEIGGAKDRSSLRSRVREIDKMLFVDSPGYFRLLRQIAARPEEPERKQGGRRE